MAYSASQYRSIRLISPAGCVIAFLGFFLTFTEINCNGKTLDTISGVELATGYSPDIDLTESTEPEEKAERYDPNIFALNAWIAALLGIILFAIPKMRDQYTLHAIVAAVGVVCMVGLMINLKRALMEAKSSGGGVVNIDLPITFDMQPGYWIVSVAFLITLVADIILLIHQRGVITEMRAQENMPADNAVDNNT